MIGVMPLSWRILSGRISRVFGDCILMLPNSYFYGSLVARKKRCWKTFVAVPIGCEISCTDFIPRCSSCARLLTSLGSGICLSSPLPPLTRRCSARAGRCWGLCRYRDLLHLKIYVRIPALEDGPPLPVERLHARL